MQTKKIILFGGMSFSVLSDNPYGEQRITINFPFKETFQYIKLKGMR
ncbi:MAG: hypothetical protein HXY48_03705 [Ignavibacteriaceae bacterium]|nr:hypothetical protein [Ignavibacteriaceae bacterium]